MAQEEATPKQVYPLMRWGGGLCCTSAWFAARQFVQDAVNNSTARWRQAKSHDTTIEASIAKVQADITHLPHGLK